MASGALAHNKKLYWPMMKATMRFLKIGGSKLPWQKGIPEMQEAMPPIALLGSKALSNRLHERTSSREQTLNLESLKWYAK
ncbi:MAG: hypothetical protein M1829_002915, partial [Trizodia sp. TS-e1964]